MLLGTITHGLTRLVKQVAERRSGKWPATRKEKLRQQTTCEACGTDKLLEAHHVIPVSHDRSKELSPENLMVLCEYRGCHFRVGHSLLWSAANPHAREDAALQLKRIRERTEKPEPMPPQTFDE